VLEITPAAPSRAPAALVDFVWGGDAWDLALHALASGGARWVRSRRIGARRELRHWRHPGGEALDLTVFHLDGERFAEAARYERAGGPNLHPVPLVLPALVELGQPMSPAPGAEVVATWHGEAEFALDGRVERRRALVLRASGGGQTRIMWLAAGVGEVALGAEGLPFDRWCVGWTGGDARFLGPLDAPGPLADLPLAAADRARGLF